MGWVDNTVGQSASADSHLAGQDVRTYLIDGNLDEALVAFKPHLVLGGLSGSEPLPALKSAHPVIDTLKLDRYDTDRDGSTLVARALYSNDGRFRYPETPEPQEEGEVRYQSGREDVTVEVPIIVTKRIPQALPPQFVGPPEAFDGFAIDFVSVRETRRKRMWTVLIKTADVQAAEDAMDAQNNRLHKLYGRWYRFQSGDIVPSGKRDYPYQTTYTWWYDRGSLFTNPIGTPGISLPPTHSSAPFSPTAMQRPPYHEFTTSQNNDASVQPTIGVWCPYDFNAGGTGWETLVGL